MTRYLLDTDILSYLMKRRFATLQARFAQISPDQYAVSAITAAEVLYGLQTLPPLHPARARAIQFLAATRILDWPADAAIAYADIRHRTRKQPLADRDMMIAANAIAIDAILVTNNTRHFTRIGSPLRIENWLW